MLRFFAAICYRVLYLLHHWLCLRPGKPLQHARLIVVGSYRTGGAGKTPFCIWLARKLAARRKWVAVLCHRYAFDEVELLRKKLADMPQVHVFATSNRYRTAHELDSGREYDVILCDDGFEDSRLVGALTFVLTWERAPTRIADLWPAGNAKSLAQDHGSAGKVVEVQCRGCGADVSFTIDKITNLSGEEIEAPVDCEQMHIFCGLGDPERFCLDLERFGVRVASRTFLRDHDGAFAKKLACALRKNPNDRFLISEKDAARLPATMRLERVYVACQKVLVREELDGLLECEL